MLTEAVKQMTPYECLHDEKKPNASIQEFSGLRAVLHLLYAPRWSITLSVLPVIPLILGKRDANCLKIRILRKNNIDFVFNHIHNISQIIKLQLA